MRRVHLPPENRKHNQLKSKATTGQETANPTNCKKNNWPATTKHFEAEVIYRSQTNKGKIQLGEKEKKQMS